MTNDLTENVLHPSENRYHRDQDTRTATHINDNAASGE